MKITANSGEPIYRQIAEQFRDQILNGKMKEGDYLPSIRGLAKELNEQEMIMADGGKIGRDTSFWYDVGYAYGSYYNKAYDFGGYIHQNGGVGGMVRTAYNFYFKN